MYSRAVERAVEPAVSGSLFVFLLLMLGDLKEDEEVLSVGV